FHDPAKTEKLPEIPGYDVLSVLGRTRMSVVYKVRNLAPHMRGRIEALKMGREKGRFRSEIEELTRFEHTSIVRIYHAGEHDGQPYFTMEYIATGTLHEHRERFQADSAAAVLMAKVARGVHVLHAKDIVHRDLKPANIFLREKDEPVIGDLGL